MANNISFTEWYSSYDDAGNCINTLDDNIIVRMNKEGLRTQQEWEHEYLITEINAMMEETSSTYSISEDTAFTKQADGTYLSMYLDISDDGDFTEYVVGWLSSHDIVYECELTEEGMTEIKITL